MKKMSILMLILFWIASFGSMEAQTVTIWKDGQRKAQVAQADSIVFEEGIIEPNATTGDLNGHEWRQLWAGGPCWATMNVGANKEYGSITSCGGVLYDFDNAQNQPAQWGEGWRMPSKEDMQELIDNCDVIWYDGVENQYNGSETAGCLLIGRNEYSNNSIYLPATGFDYFGMIVCENLFAGYWTCSTLGEEAPSDAWYLGAQWDDYFGEIDIRVYQCFKTYGYNVRLICDPQ